MNREVVDVFPALFFHSVLDGRGSMLLLMLFFCLLKWRAVMDMGANVVFWICMDPPILLLPSK